VRGDYENPRGERAPTQPIRPNVTLRFSTVVDPDAILAPSSEDYSEDHLADQCWDESPHDVSEETHHLYRADPYEAEQPYPYQSDPYQTDIHDSGGLSLPAYSTPYASPSVEDLDPSLVESLRSALTDLPPMALKSMAASGVLAVVIGVFALVGAGTSPDGIGNLAATATVPAQPLPFVPDPNINLNAMPDSNVVPFLAETALSDVPAEVESTTTTEAPETTGWVEPTVEPAADWADGGNGVRLPDVLLRIRFCESTNNYGVANTGSSARGAYQFLSKSWDWYGHADRYGVDAAHLATPAQQDEAALITFEKDGARPWAESRPCWDDDGISSRYSDYTPAPITTTTTTAPSSTTAEATTTVPATTAPATTAPATTATTAASTTATTAATTTASTDSTTTSTTAA